jgi:hypothetical protein
MLSPLERQFLDAAEKGNRPSLEACLQQVHSLKSQFWFLNALPNPSWEIIAGQRELLSKSNSKHFSVDCGKGMDAKFGGNFEIFIWHFVFIFVLFCNIFPFLIEGGKVWEFDF